MARRLPLLVGTPCRKAIAFHPPPLGPRGVAGRHLRLNKTMAHGSPAPRLVIGLAVHNSRCRVGSFFAEHRIIGLQKAAARRGGELGALGAASGFAGPLLSCQIARSSALHRAAREKAKGKLLSSVLSPGEVTAGGFVTWKPPPGAATRFLMSLGRAGVSRRRSVRVCLG